MRKQVYPFDKYDTLYFVDGKSHLAQEGVVEVCGRYQFTEEQSEEIRHIVQEIEKKHGGGAWKPGEIRPTEKAPVLLASEDGPTPELFTWGYKMPKMLVINAKAETAASKPMFRESVLLRRCVIPSTGFWEWDARKRKYLFTLPGENVLYMAGLYDVRDGSAYYCILTTKPNESMREVHDRMPLVLTRDRVRPWLEQVDMTDKILRSTPPPLEKTAAESQYSLW